MSAICPCCSQVMESELELHQLRFLKFGFIETTLLRTLMIEYPDFMMKNRLLDQIYGKQAPENAPEVLSITKKRLSKKIEPFGWQIVSSHGGRSGARYALRKV